MDRFEIQDRTEDPREESLRKQTKEFERKVDDVLISRIDLATRFAHREAKTFRNRIQEESKRRFKEWMREERAGKVPPGTLQIKAQSWVQQVDTKLSIRAGVDGKIIDPEELRAATIDFLNPSLEALEVKDPRVDSVLSKLQKKEPLTQNDWVYLQNKVEVTMDLIKRPKDALKETSCDAILLLKSMDAAQRMELCRLLLQKPGREEFVLAITEINFLSRDQAELLLQNAKQTINYKNNPRRLQGLDQALATLNSQAFEQRMQNARTKTEAALDALRGSKEFRTYHAGASNLSVEGLLRNFMKISGVLTIISNILSNWSNKSNIVNPATLFGAAMLMGGMELNDIDPLSQKVAGAVEKARENPAAQEKKKVLDSMEYSFGLKPRAAELAVAYAPDFKALYQAKKSPAEPRPMLTLSEAGVDYEKLPPRFRGVSEKELNTSMTQWFYERERHTDVLSEPLDELIQDARAKRGLTLYAKPSEAPWIQDARKQINTSHP